MNACTMWLRFLGAVLLGYCWAAAAQVSHLAQSDQRYLAQIELHSAAELEGILHRAELLYSERQYSAADPVIFVLHGAEGRVFLRQSYTENKTLIDLAARLSALQVVDIRVCESWMGGQNIDPAQLLPFVDTVPNGPKEILRLMNEENYSYF